MIVKDWIAEAAEEILSSLHYQADGELPGDVYVDTTPSEITDIIRRHSPFADSVDYMPVPRCDECRRWQPRDDLPYTGFCGLREDQDVAKIWPELYDGIVTQADFGCVQFEKKT